MKNLCQAVCAAVLAGLMVAACHDKTLVLNPNAEAERSRAENVAKPFMERSCGGQSYKVLEDLLIDNVTLSLRFRCGV
jgi:hypothetical protein